MHVVSKYVYTALYVRSRETCIMLSATKHPCRFTKILQSSDTYVSLGYSSVVHIGKLYTVKVTVVRFEVRHRFVTKLHLHCERN